MHDSGATSASTEIKGPAKLDLQKKCKPISTDQRVKTASDKPTVKPAESPDIVSDLPEDIVAQRISPPSPKISEGGPDNLQNKPLFDHSFIGHLPTEDHRGRKPQRFNATEVASSTSPTMPYSGQPAHSNIHPTLPASPIIPSLPIMPGPYSLGLVGSAHYPAPNPYLRPAAHEADLRNKSGAYGSFASSTYPSDNPFQNIDPQLLPSGPVPFLYPNPILDPGVQTDDPFYTRPLPGHPGYVGHDLQALELSKPIYGGGVALGSSDNPVSEGRASDIKSTRDASLKITIAPPKGTPKKTSPEKRNQGKRKRTQDEDSIVIQPTTPLRSRPERIRKTPIKYTG